MSTEEFDSNDLSVLSWQDQVRRGLASDDVRLRLHTYSMLSTKCSESKEMQKQVGQLFGGPRNGITSRFATSSLINALFDDLRSTDRTLRIAAARVLCLMTYENLRNQQLIIQSQVNGDEEQIGATVGWVHVFSIPPCLRDRYEAQCEERGLFTTTSGLVDFVSDVIKDNYASIYSRIGRYYAGGCSDFLPVCWFHDFVNDSSESTDLMDIPDPNDNLVGFYLVPRQMQFPEQDAYFLQEILTSIRTEAELSRLQQVHTAFEKVAFRAKESNAAALMKALEGAYNRSVGGEEMNQGYRNLLSWLNASPERMVTWNELLIWCCTDMNAEEMLKRFGADACKTIDGAFRRLTLDNDKMQLQQQATTYIWESTLVGTLLEHRDIPEGLKANLRVLSSGYVTRLELSRRKVGSNSNNISITSTPWEYLLPLELTEIHPISWSVFLSKWRQSLDSKPDEESHIYHQNERRHHSVGEHSHPSVLIARKNALVSLSNSPRIFHSFRDLNQLRQQLPLIANRPSEVAEEVAESVPMSNRLKSITENQLSAVEQRDLEEKRKLFRKLQQSSIELDELTRQQLEKKRKERYKAHEKAAENRVKKQQLATQRQQELERRRHDRQLKVQERVKRKEYRWQSRIAVRQERHERAQWWKQVQQDAEIERQEEFMQQLKEERESADSLRNRSEFIVAPVSVPQLPPKAPCSRRPQSARTPTDRHIIRERANVYGCAATNAFAARRPHSARADIPDTRSRRRVHPPENKGDAQTEATTTIAITGSNTIDPTVPGLVNACQTLVMTNAAHSVAQEIAIPSVTGPVPEDQFVSPAIIMAQYLALEKDQRLKLHERYCGNRVSHKLTFAVLQQLTHEMRQDAAWREFLKAAGGPPGVNASKRNKSKRDAKVTYAAFASVAAQLGITTPPKKLQAVARSLDPWKTGFVTWEAFYTWWSSQ